MFYLRLQPNGRWDCHRLSPATGSGLLYPIGSLDIEKCLGVLLPTGSEIRELVRFRTYALKHYLGTIFPNRFITETMA